MLRELNKYQIYCSFMFLNIIQYICYNYCPLYLYAYEFCFTTTVISAGVIMSIDAEFSNNIKAATNPSAGDGAVKNNKDLTHLAMDFKSGWASSVATKQVFQITPYTTVGGKPVCNGAAGYDPRSGAYGIRPIFCPK